MIESPVLDRVLFVVPARGGSTRVLNKNIRKLTGKPLLVYTLEALLGSKYKLTAVVSTNDTEIERVTKGAGVQVIQRPVEISTSTASTESALLHALDVVEGQSGKKFEWIATVPPTSPFRNAAVIDRFLDEWLKNPEGQDCLMTINENRGDFWVKEAGGLIKRLFPNAPRRQQDREPLYDENSAIYLSRVSVLRNQNTVLGKTVRGVEISALEAFDINTEQDFLIAESLMGQK